MFIRFHIHFDTQWGQQLFLSGTNPDKEHQIKDDMIPMVYTEDGKWELSLEFPDTLTELSYRYLLFNEQHASIEKEFQVHRKIVFDAATYNTVEVFDQWHPQQHANNVYLSSAFTGVLHQRESAPSVKSSKSASTSRNLTTHRFQLRAPEVPPHLQVFLSGNDPLLGNWNPDQALPLADDAFPVWQVDVPFRGKSRPIEYKFILKSTETGALVAWENGSNRQFAYQYSRKRKKLTVLTAESLQVDLPSFKGAGVAIPVFSLRSSASGGIGEFLDLRGFTDWATGSHLTLIQILPINDTTATHSWVDSYPYSGISVFALHPIYIRPASIAQLEDATKEAELESRLAKLNLLAEIDYEAVLQTKIEYLHLLYQQEKEDCFRDPEYQAFFADHHSWLRPYAAFAALRDRFGTADFSQWEAFSVFQEAAIAAFTDPDTSHFDEIGIHYFIQFHLHQQLLQASLYAKSKGVILKGDIPIGIYRHSVDAWMSPHLFYMDAQAGAPPDDFAIHGQNWRFPTYNWEEMAKDDFAWWKQRMSHLSTYFDSYRIDHILGFFRIWEIPGHAVQGILGQFNPSLPLSHDELLARGIWMDEDRFCSPYIRAHFLREYFGGHTDSVVREFLDEYQPSCFRMKHPFQTQRQIESYVEKRIEAYPESKPYYESIVQGLYRLLTEVLFFRSKDGRGYCPRISIFETRSFQEMDWEKQERIKQTYHDFFYHRHEHFWQEQAMVKLPAICEATDMLVCGEDLGMVPACVPGVMQELGLLSLEIQRMPKDPSREFDHPHHAPYLSVISPSSHDMPGIRAWWEQDSTQTQRFYQQILGGQGSAPFFCEPWIAEQIILQHLESPAMWAIFPIQDLLAMDGQIRRENPHDEQINVPANPKNYWRYRFHMTNDQLIESHSFNQLVGRMIHTTGRSPLSSWDQLPHSLTSVIVTS
ncbi:MAG: 4-alpha-glucanotransferase [Bacteroidota bacterium]